MRQSYSNLRWLHVLQTLQPTWVPQGTAIDRKFMSKLCVFIFISRSYHPFKILVTYVYETESNWMQLDCGQFATFIVTFLAKES